MRFALILIFLASVAPAHAGVDKPIPPAPKKLLDGSSAGYADHSSTSLAGDSVVFSFQKKPILTLNGKVALNWFKRSRTLGPCYRLNPAVSIVDKQGRKAAVYRFKGGIIVDSPVGVVALLPPAVKAWEASGAQNGPLGFPIENAPVVPRNPRRQPKSQLL